MSQDSKRSPFISLFGSNSKTEKKQEADQESRQKLEERIREVLAIIEVPELPGPDQA
jgi:hypothetical protein